MNAATQLYTHHTCMDREDYYITHQVVHLANFIKDVANGAIPNAPIYVRIKAGRTGNLTLLAKTITTYYAVIKKHNIYIILQGEWRTTNSVIGQSQHQAFALMKVLQYFRILDVVVPDWEMCTFPQKEFTCTSSFIAELETTSSMQEGAMAGVYMGAPVVKILPGRRCTIPLPGVTASHCTIAVPDCVLLSRVQKHIRYTQRGVDLHLDTHKPMEFLEGIDFPELQFRLNVRLGIINGY